MAAVSLLSEGAGASIATGGRILLSSTSNSSLLWAEESRLQLRTPLHPSKEPLGREGGLLFFPSPLVMLHVPRWEEGEAVFIPARPCAEKKV